MSPCIYVSLYLRHISECINTTWVVWGMGSVHLNIINLGKNHNFTILSYVFFVYWCLQQCYLLIHFWLMGYSYRIINIFSRRIFSLVCKICANFVFWNVFHSFIFLGSNLMRREHRFITLLRRHSLICLIYSTGLSRLSTHHWM